MSHFADYLSEFSNKSVIETEYGFATYSFPDKETCYIEDIYVAPTSRKSKECYKMADQIVSIALERGCSKLLGSVVPAAKNSTISLKVLLGYGMTLDSSSNNFILFRKAI